jgi:hypothetical protein
MRNFERWIPDLTGLLTAIVLLCSFILSFSNLRYAAEISQIDPVLTWAWPLCIDSLLVSGSLLILRNSIRRESTRFGWLVLSVFTGISIAFNVAVSPSNLLSQASHAVPPVTLMVSIEILMSIVRSDLAGKIPEETGEESGDPGNVTSPVTLLHRDPSPGVTSEQVLQFYRTHPDATFVTASSHLNIARQTVSRHITRLREDGKILKDGDRFIVVDQDNREFA